MSLKFLVDEQINPRVAQALRDKGIAAISIHDLGLENQGYQDEPLLALAVERNETLLTMDEDFTQIHARWQSKERAHRGIFYGASDKFQRKGAIGIVVRFCVEWAELIDEEVGTLEDDIYNKITFIKE